MALREDGFTGTHLFQVSGVTGQEGVLATGGGRDAGRQVCRVVPNTALGTTTLVREPPPPLGWHNGQVTKALTVLIFT